MTENKRFEIVNKYNHNELVRDNENVIDGYVQIYGIESVVLRMNELAEENEQLKQQISDCKDYTAKLYANHTRNDRQFVKEIRELEKENEELKQQVRQLSLICEKKAKFIQSKGFDIQELIYFARDGSND